jgi:RNA recognition motif-containing protein
LGRHIAACCCCCDLFVHLATIVVMTTPQTRYRGRTTLAWLSLISLLLSLSIQCTDAFTSPYRDFHRQSTHLAAAATASSTTSSQQDESSSSPPRRFAQPQFQKANDNNPSRKKQNFGSDSKLMSLHSQRIKTAGRKGTKRFVDPCKVFVGNLPYDVDGEQMAAFILNTMGQSRLILHSAKVIHDWKTGQSKGYGFVEFTDPIFATVCMDVCHNKLLNGRPVSVSQGKKKDQENALYVVKKKKAETEEDSVIENALELAENNEEEYEAEELDVDEDGIAVFGDNDDADIELDAQLFGLTADDEEDDDDDIDGIFLEQKSKYHLDMDPNLNREQRREAARRIKKKKLPSKGFG